MSITPLAADDLKWLCCDQQFEFDSTKQLNGLDGPIGQERAMAAIELSLAMPNDGFNLFITGQTGTGRTSAIRQILEERAKGEPVPDDWCYVHDLEQGASPVAFSVPHGLGKQLQEDMAELIRRLSEQLPKLFKSKEYEQYKGKTTEEFQLKSKKLLEDLEQEAAEQGFEIQRSVSGLVLVPAKDGEALTQAEYDALDEESRKEIDQKGGKLQKILNGVLAQTREIESEVQQAVSKMEEQIVDMTTSHLFAELMDHYQDYDEVVEHLDRCRRDIVNNVSEFRPRKERQLIFSGGEDLSERFWSRFEVNLLIDNQALEGAPVVFENNPTYFNLFGRIEHVFRMGNATTDFTMIKAGALHRANGGYLVLNCRDLLMNYFSYEAIKRCLRRGDVVIEDIAEQARLISMASLKPGPIPFSGKIVLVGDAHLYNLLHHFDPDFGKFFKIRADFNSSIDNTWDNVTRYAQFIAVQCRDHDLPHFEPGAVSRVVEHAARLTEDQNKLSSKFLDLADLIKEAGFYAHQQGREKVAAQHVLLALESRRYRNNRIEDELRRLIVEGTIMVDFAGAVVGQINGLSVYMQGDYQFGLPTRITATTSIGRGGVVAVEREVKQSGAVHDKGVMILSGFFAQRFGQNKPLTFSASLCFEQTYGGVDGDSASSTELYALISSLSGLSLRQDIAVTGSVNQHGQVQAIGGVNEKIEGFFTLCNIVGLTGRQGVMIPRANVKNLMLNGDVVAACRDGRFHVWAVSTIDEGLELLTGTPAGEFVDGQWSEGSVNARVDQRLTTMVETLMAFAKKNDAATENHSGS
ncbi:AAA family ATPase [Desulfuromonas acetoxidans]|uniref:endopeptidase La n=1 Tax=Desulfuromonas acetoxidans (strain DSM 684 / 11070) TaxID=281689 RepID=Q1JY33_DESA6|nr:ATP-binding protein [Desulfuromonas acetoxidans]EAT15163.1 ATP-dependent protease, putative [Desulfuromonas acetoxidans DSM 684]MBF0643989.1 AAA family ATPase [Desulfuromonas acetoxidans]NVD23227.1 AAA family ATPase [Desulfuromonas acetoxidans]NVE15532.1 AAA family ATPase [Desulfuromonas acetoxidans]